MKQFFRYRRSRVISFLSGGLLVVSLLPFTVGAQPASSPPGGVVDATFNTVSADFISASSSGSDDGVSGFSQDGNGVYGESSNGFGVSGQSNFDSGVYGTGVYGLEGSGTTHGAYLSGGTYGAFGIGSNYGFYGSSGGGSGVTGLGNTGVTGIGINMGALIMRNSAPTNRVLLSTATYGVDSEGTVRAPEYCIDADCITSWAATVEDNSVTTNSVVNNNITYAKLQDMNSDRLLGRDANGVGDPGEISLTGSLAFTGSNSIQLSGDNSSPGTSKYYGTNSGGSKGWYPLPSSGSSFWTDSGDVILPTAAYDTLKVGTTSGFGDGSMNSGIVASGYYTPGKYSAVTSNTFPTFTYDGRAGMSIDNGASGYGGFGKSILFFVGNYLNQPFIMSYFNDGGSYAYKLGGTSWGNMSDLRLKDRITPYERGLDEIMALEPIRYHYKANMNTKLQANPDEEYTGFGAQDVQKVIPEAIDVGEDGYLTLNADPIHWAAINAIKELKTENDELKARIEALEAKLQ